MSKRSDKQKPLDELRRLYEEHLRANLLAGLTQGGMKQRVEQLLDGAAGAVIASTLGLSKDRWGRDVWEVSNRNAPLLKELGQHAMEAARAAVPGFVEQFAYKQVPKALLKRLKEEYEDAYESHITTMLRQAAYARATSDLAQLEAVMRAPVENELESLALEHGQSNEVDLDAGAP